MGKYSNQLKAREAAKENDRYLILFLLGVIATIIFAISAYRTIKI